ncbi:MAG: PqqD family protein [Desulfobacterales bacterium]|nr:PqqD family protein [Desulfobacterales bacterium]
MEKFQLKESVVYRREEDGALIYDHESGNIKPLNQTAAAMCELLFMDFRSKEDTLGEIKKRWRVSDEDLVRRDIDDFIAGMKKLDFIVSVE